VPRPVHLVNARARRGVPAAAAARAAVAPVPPSSRAHRGGPSRLREFSFRREPDARGRYEWDIGTAGSAIPRWVLRLRTSRTRPSRRKSREGCSGPAPSPYHLPRAGAPRDAHGCIGGGRGSTPRLRAGGVSKTVHLPPDVSVERIVELIQRARELGCKGVAFWRSEGLAPARCNRCAPG
jgi:hypothetical protein